MSEVGLFWLLLPTAAALSWYFARRGSERSSGAQVHRLRTNYFRGLNYLLNEQPDKAIEVFLKIAEVDSDTVETHLALGNLFRRRGEVDRAIRVHQNLISRPTLSAEQKTAALLELGEDYMRAGLLDRAETLFSDLVNIDARAPSALKHLISIYQQERDWHKAIDHARRLEQATGESQGRVIAQYFCELTEHSRTRHDLESARRHLAEAFGCEAHCVRGRIIEGQMAIDAGEPERALQSFERVVEQDMEFVPEVLQPALRCYERLHEPLKARGFLRGLSERYAGISPVLALAKLIEREDGDDAAVGYLTEQLRVKPSVRGLMALIDLNLKSATGPARENLLILKELTRKLVEGKAVYRCSRCGFGARAHHWQCPGCKSWGSVKPIHGVAGD
ncbi:MAG TPA: lipopolysaccharide assembly protein LapB [Candidatus Saccharimonadia bacterium]|nr:lipopolysaccharide assembly protein LapB [Candidatus Saccharimonadia bacterium]